MRSIGRSLVLLALAATGPASAQSIINGDFEQSVPSNGSAHGWVSADIDQSGGWRSTGGNPGAMFILNSGGLLVTDPMVGQVLTGLTAGQIYLVHGQYANWYYNTRPANASSFIAKVDSQTVFVGEAQGIREWRDFSFAFIANGPTATITLQGEAYGTDNDFAIDNITMELTACSPCPADYDLDGSVTMADLSAFFQQWQEGDTCADVDQNGGIDAADLWNFIDVFQAGGC